MRYVWLLLVPLLACAKTAIWDNPGWENPVEVIIETSSDGQSWTVAGCQPDGQTLSLTVPDANYYRARAIERGPAATGDCDIANAERVSGYSNVVNDPAELLPYSAVTVAPVLPWATEQEPPVMAQPTVGATVSSQTDNNSPWSALSHTVDASTDLLIVAITGWNDSNDYMISGGANPAVSSATWTKSGESGQAMTALNPPTVGSWNAQGTREATGYFILEAPNIGAGTITFGNGQTPQEGLHFIAVNVQNVDDTVGTSGIRDTESNSSEGASTSATVDSSADDLILALLYTYNENTITWTSGGTSLYSAISNSAAGNLRSFPGAETSKTISVSATDYPALFVLSIAGAAGGSTDDLAGDDLVAGTPTLDTPALGQTHVLSGSDLSASAPVLDTPALGQVHGLGATDLAAGTPVLDTPALSETSALTGDDLTAGTPTLDSPAIGQTHALTGSDLSAGTPTLGTPELAEGSHALTGSDLIAGTPALDSPTLGQIHALSGTDLSASAPVLDSPALGQTHALSATDLVSGTPVLDSPSIGQIHGLTGSDLTAGTPTLDTPVLAEGNYVLIGDDLTAGTPALDTPAFGQIHALTGSDLAAGNPLLDSPVFGQIHALSATDLAPGTPVLDTPALSEATALTGSNLTAGTPVLDSPTIAQIHVLIPDDLITGIPTLTSADLGQIHGLLGNDLVAGTPVLDSPTLGEAGGFLIYTATVGTSTGAGASASGSSGWAAN